jgi:AraC-like DNA-binding protein
MLARMRPCHVEELAAGGVDCFVVGRTFLHFCKTPTLWGVVFWGRPNHEDAFELARSLPLELRAPAVPHASIVDASRLSGIDVSAFSQLDGYVRAEFESLSQGVTRLALVRPAGVEGAVVAGFFQVLPRPYPVQVFDKVAPALGWLGEGVEIPAGFAEELESVYAAASATSPLLTQIRAYLEAHLPDANISEAAKALAVSERTLQRRLSEANTTFQDELGQARLRVSERLLLDTDAPLTRIALDVGCASLQHFSAFFRKLTGESPSAWRARHKQ